MIFSNLFDRNSQWSIIFLYCKAYFKESKDVLITRLGYSVLAVQNSFIAFGEKPIQDNEMRRKKIPRITITTTTQRSNVFTRVEGKVSKVLLLIALNTITPVTFNYLSWSLCCFTLHCFTLAKSYFGYDLEPVYLFQHVSILLFSLFWIWLLLRKITFENNFFVIMICKHCTRTDVRLN